MSVAVRGKVEEMRDSELIRYRKKSESSLL